MPGGRPPSPEFELSTVIRQDDQALERHIERGLARFVLATIAPGVNWEAIDNLLAEAQGMMDRQREEEMQRIEGELESLDKERMRLIEQIA